MQPSQIKKGIQLLPKNIQTEASGNINEKILLAMPKLVSAVFLWAL